MADKKRKDAANRRRRLILSKLGFEEARNLDGSTERVFLPQANYRTGFQCP